jgi:hypothetical protein
VIRTFVACAQPSDIRNGVATPGSGWLGAVGGGYPMRRRYMRQGTFDSLVIVRAMADLTEDDRPFFDLVRRYVEMYPSEHAQALVDDANDAVVTAWKLTKVIVELRPSNSEMSTTASLYSVLEQLKNIMEENADLDQTGRNVISIGSLFNSSSTPLPNRIETCRDDLGFACQHILMNSSSY